MKNRRDQIAEARRLGITVETVRRTGEIRFLSPMGDVPSVKANNRRKDGTRAVEAMLKRHAPTPDPTPAKEPPPVPVKPTQTRRPSADDVARAFVHGHSTADVLRLMAREKGADPRIRHLVTRLDAKAIRQDPPPPSCSATCEWCARHPFTPHPVTAKEKAS